MPDIEIIKLSGPDIKSYLEQLATLRIEVFREFPYLYDGDHAYELEYLQRYVEAKDAAVFLAIEGEKVVGASTCLPLTQEIDAIRLPMTSTDFPENAILYLGESVLLSPYRGRGIGLEFFRLREAHARDLDKAYCCFCAVDRPENHPLKPKAYRNLHAFWKKRGYSPLPGIKTQLKWKDVNQDQETSKSLMFWIKALDEA
jgi:GNAT superfamily N-acetyltransferase